MNANAAAILSLVLSLCFSGIARAGTYSVMGGANWGGANWPLGGTRTYSETNEHRPALGWQLGYQGSYGLGESLGIEPGLVFISRSIELNFGGDATYNSNSQSLLMPVQFRNNFSDQWSASVGVVFDLSVSGDLDVRMETGLNAGVRLGERDGGFFVEPRLQWFPGMNRAYSTEILAMFGFSSGH